jgi:hypothetical protein
MMPTVPCEYVKCFRDKHEKEKSVMSSTTIATAIRMLEFLPEATQEQVVEHLREYIADLEDERQWDITFKKTQPQLIAAARRAKEEIAKGQAQPMDFDQL